MSELKATALATPEGIAQLTDDLMSFLQREKVDRRATHHVALVVEEVMTNLGTHGNCRDKPARITVTIEPKQIKGEIIDTGPEFDPRQAPAPNLEASAEERGIGGLGLHLVRELSSALEYSRRNGENCTMFAIARS